ncbi:MAG TPA: DUF559 domain-containing protein [Fulvivirga sp.]|nr:DUF559 domain-containing protein [Fulvivirga sp.]
MKASKENLYLYNPKLKERANYLRKNMTKAEACIWKYVLKSGSLQGYKFRRQRPIMNYITDFVCFELMLIIEIDGITHTYENADKKDAVRQRNLEGYGFKVLRYTDEEVLTVINRVVFSLEDWIGSRDKTTP